MKRLLIATVVFLSVGLSSCQCSEKPDVGPVEGEDTQAHRVASPSALDSLPA